MQNNDALVWADVEVLVPEKVPVPEKWRYQQQRFVNIGLSV